MILFMWAWLCHKVTTRRDFRFYYFWLCFVYQHFYNGNFQISLFHIIFEVICGKWFFWIYCIIINVLLIFLLDKKNILLYQFFLVRFEIYYLILLVEKAIVNLWSFYLEVNILSYFANSKGYPFPCFCFPKGNILLSKPLRTFSLCLRGISAFWKVNAFVLFVLSSLYHLV